MHGKVFKRTLRQIKKVENIIMKKLTSIFLALSASSLLLSCNGKRAEEKPITLLMAESNPVDSISGQVDLAFADKVKELSNGKMTVNIQFSGILGDEAKVMEMIVKPDSSIQLARVSASLASYGGQKSKLITIPFTFENSDHFWKFAKSSIAEEILNEPYENNLGVKGIFYAEEGFRHFFSGSKIESINDIAGKRTRSSNSKTLQDLISALKAIPVTVPFADLYASLQTGQTEIAEQPLTNYYSNGFHVVAPYIILDGHMLGAVQVLINSKCYDSLTESQQNILKEAGKYATDYCRLIIEEKEAETLKNLEAEGTAVVKVTDISPWRSACREMISESSKALPDLYQKILDIGK